MRLPVSQPPTAKARRVLESYSQRWWTLLEQTRAGQRDKRNLWNRFVKFQKDISGLRQATDATPMNVVNFLLHCDTTGRVVVHQESCQLWRQTASRITAACGCPKRAAATSVNTIRGRLQGIFCDMGFTGPWNPLTWTGNPVASFEVDQLVKRVRQEQFAAGLTKQKSLLISEDVYVAIMRGLIQEAKRAWSKRCKKAAVVWYRDALWVAVCWHTGLRLQDALRILCQQITPRRGSDGRPGLELRVLVTKTRHDSRGERKLWIPDSSEFGALSVVLARYKRLLRMAGAPKLEAGLLFANIVLAGKEGTGRPRYQGVLSKAMAARHFGSILDALQMTRQIKPHSLHGSHAARDRDAGVPKETTCRNIDWTGQTYDDYLQGREVIGLMEAKARAVVMRTDADGGSELRSGRGKRVGRYSRQRRQ
jgi:hypothetical protein